MKANTLNDVLEHEMHDLRDAEKQILEALPKVIGAVSSPKVKEALQGHQKLTEQHLTRLDRAFKKLGIEPNGQHCKGMEGLIKEGEDVIKAEGSGAAKDAAIIGATQRVEHYEMAAYGCARTHARQRGEMDVAEILLLTLEEEGQADQRLTHLAEYNVNLEAAGAKTRK